MLSQTDAKLQTTLYEYNVANKPVRRMDPGGKLGAPGSYTYIIAKTEAYTYYADGNMKTSKDRNGRITAYSYDIHGRLLGREIGSKAITYTYDSNGNQLTMTDGTGITERTYDAENRVLTKTVPYIGTIAYQYDILEANGCHSEISTDPKGNVTRKIFDKTGRLAEVIEGGNSTSYEYYADGSRRNVTYPDGSREDYTYYDDNLLKTLVNKKGDGTVIDSYSYTYDGAHNQTSKTDNKGLTKYEYDSLNRLSKVTEPSGKTTSYLYDRAGNRIQETVLQGNSSTTTTYSYNEQNRLTDTITRAGFATEKVKYEYDNNGNTLVKLKETTKPVDPELSGSFAFNKAGTSTVREVSFMDYDVWNQMIRAIDGDKAIEYRYNGEGYRVEKSVNNLTTRYMCEASKVILEVDGQGNQTAKNTYGTKIISRTAGNETAYYMYNGHGDVTALIGTNGEIAATYYYDAFGNITEQTGEVKNPIKYAGYQYDEETGVYYLNARYYDPKIARFLTEDTYRGDPSDPLSLNLYTYCANEPIKYTDPTGHLLIVDDGTVYNHHTGNIINTKTGETTKLKDKDKDKDRDNKSKDNDKKKEEAIQRFYQAYNQVFRGVNLSKIPKPTMPNAKKDTDEIGELFDFSNITIEEIDGITRGMLRYIAQNTKGNLPEGAFTYNTKDETTLIWVAGNSGMEPKGTGETDSKLPNLIDQYKTVSDATMLVPVMALGIASGGGDAKKTTAALTTAATAAAKIEAAKVVVAEKGQQAVYTLREAGTNIVKYVGRTINPAAREAAHKLAEDKADLIFNLEKTGLTYEQVRGAEQKLFENFGGFEKLLNKINPISPNNPNLQKYIDAAKELFR